MKYSFWGLIWQSFLKIQGVILALVSIAIGLLAWVFSAKIKVSIVWLIITIIFTLILIVTFFNAIYIIFNENKRLQSNIDNLRESNQNLDDKIKKLIKPPIRVIQKDENSELIRCLLEDSDLFSEQSVLSFYYEDEDGFQRFIGSGFVETINDSGKIQAIIDNILPEYQNIFDKLINNETKVIKQTFVKLGIPKGFM